MSLAGGWSRSPWLPRPRHPQRTACCQGSHTRHLPPSEPAPTASGPRICSPAPSHKAYGGWRWWEGTGPPPSFTRESRPGGGVARKAQKLQLSAGKTGTSWSGQEAGSQQARVPGRSLLSCSGMDMTVGQSVSLAWCPVFPVSGAGRTLVLAGRPFTNAPCPAARALLCGPVRVSTYCVQLQDTVSSPQNQHLGRSRRRDPPWLPEGHGAADQSCDFAQPLVVGGGNRGPQTDDAAAKKRSRRVPGHRGDPGKGAGETAPWKWQLPGQPPATAPGAGAAPRAPERGPRAAS